MTTPDPNDVVAAAAAKLNEAPTQPVLDTPQARAEATTKMMMAHPDQIPQRFKDAEGKINQTFLYQSVFEIEGGKPDPTPAAQSVAADGVNTPAPEVTSTPASDAASLNEALNGKPAPEGADLWKQAEAELSKGDLTEATLKGLRENGVPDSLIAAAAHGASSKQADDMKQAHAICGGEENFNKTMKWCRDTMDPASVAAITEGFNGPNALHILRGLFADASAATAPSGQVNTMQNPGVSAIAPDQDANLQPFATPRDQHAALMDPRYKTDATFRTIVEKRLMLGSGATREQLTQIYGR